jgi:hypothetical protein
VIVQMAGQTSRVFVGDSVLSQGQVHVASRKTVRPPAGGEDDPLVLIAAGSAELGVFSQTPFDEKERFPEGRKDLAVVLGADADVPREALSFFHNGAFGILKLPANAVFGQGNGISFEFHAHRDCFGVPFRPGMVR